MTRGEMLVELGQAAKSSRVPSRVAAAVASLIATAASVREDDLEITLTFLRDLVRGRGCVDDVLAAVRVGITIAKLDMGTP